MNKNTIAVVLVAMGLLTTGIIGPAAATTTQQVSDNETQTTTTTQSTPSNETTTTATTPTQTQSDTTVTTTSAQTTTETATATPTTTTATTTEDTSCSVSTGEALLSQNRLYAQEQSINTDSPGQIAGGFQVAPDADCPIVVRVTLQVPSGMQISGASDVLSGGAGMVSGTFTVDEASGIKDIRADVYSTQTGERTVTADITYWPQGHEEMARELDGLAFTFSVESPSDTQSIAPGTESPTPNAERTASLADVPFESGIIGGLMALLLVAILARRQ